MTVDLVVRDISVRFGGVHAVDDVSLTASGGAITGLIGPNGAGKTTTFNAIAGTVPMEHGTAQLGDDVLDRMGVAARAQKGLGRTFQRMELFDTMTVWENVTLGPELLYAGRRVWTHMLASPAERREAQERAAAAVEQCGISSIAHRSAGDLSTGQRRLTELARTMASPFRFLLLDEPSSGLDEVETRNFGAILLDLIDNLGVGVLLVEHDMSLVRAVCSYTYVLDFGKQIYEGPTLDVLSNDAVRAAYLGRESVEQFQAAH